MVYVEDNGITTKRVLSLFYFIFINKSQDKYSMGVYFMGYCQR